MRIIAGEFRSRRLKSVPGLEVRPTPDRLRESLFSVLMPRLPGAVFLDAYAGSGAVGLEALSRGAQRVILMERSGAALAVIRDNVESLGVKQSVTVLRGAAVALIPKYPCEIAFVDPPYEKTQEYEDALLALSATACSLVIAQHASRFQMADVYADLMKARVLKQGDNTLSFFERRA
jgi:16S rRNA (guanine(966)-N(2))-methyltransferase RsmD